MNKHFLPMAVIVANALQSAGLRADAGETAAFARQLEHIQAETYEVKFPEVKWRALLPIKSNIPLGFRSSTYRMFEGFGEAKLLDNFATEDFPTAEMKGTEHSQVIRSIGDKYLYSVEDLRASKLMNVQLDAEKAKIARRVIERKFDTLCATGGGPFVGLLNHTYANAFTPVTKTAGGTKWLNADLTFNATYAEIIADIRNMVEGARLATASLYDAFDLVVGSKGDVALSRPYFDPAGRPTGRSIGQEALAGIPYLRSISFWNKCDTAGASSKERIVCYPRDPEVLEARVPLDFEQFAPQLSGMSFVTHCHATFGGVVVRQAKALWYADGTQV
jgi:hypothetical protein